jgi:N-terminal domain of reverse transcriptase
MSTQSPTGVQEWRDIDWPMVETDVHTLQRRIYRASQKGDVKVAPALPRQGTWAGQRTIDLEESTSDKD